MITLKDGLVEQGKFTDFMVPRIIDMPTFANATTRLTGKPQRHLPVASDLTV